MKIFLSFAMEMTISLILIVGVMRLINKDDSEVLSPSNNPAPVVFTTMTSSVGGTVLAK